MTNKQRQQKINKLKVERRVSKILKELDLFDKERKDLKSTIQNRFKNKQGNYTNSQIKKLDELVKRVKTKKFKSKSIFNQNKAIFGAKKYNQFANNMRNADKNWRNQFKNKQAKDLGKQILNPNADFYYTYKEVLIIPYNEAKEGSKLKKQLGAELEDAWNNYKNEKQQKDAEDIASNL